MGEVWTEVFEGGVLTWFWDSSSLGVIVTSMDGYHLTEAEFDAISRYADNKEFDMLLNKEYDESGFDGTLEEYVRERARGNL